MKVYGIIGYPLGHSFSQKYFTEKFIKEAITDCSYQIFPMQTVAGLKDLIAANPQLYGLNITIPHKQTVVNLLDDISHLPQHLNACNCIKIEEGKLTGFNTDVIGFEQSLLPQLKNHHTHALILGSGGAAEAVKFVLQKLHIQYKVVSRKLHDGTDIIYDNLCENIMAENTLIINTTPLGTFPNIGECPVIPYQYLTTKHLLYDLVYNPPKTLFLKKGEEHGAATKNGYDMLVLQAEESWKIWNT